jgi:hypothetical protein
MGLHLLYYKILLRISLSVRKGPTDPTKESLFVINFEYDSDFLCE